MALATQCPHCGTMFRVASDQLKLRGGIVRCGACQEIFDGSATLVDLDQAPAPAPAPDAAPHDPAPVDAAPVDAAAPRVPDAALPDASAPEAAPAAVSSPVPSAPAGEAEPAPVTPEDELPFTIVEPEDGAETGSTDAQAPSGQPDFDGQPIYTLDFDHTFDPLGILPKADAPDGAGSAGADAAPADEDIDALSLLQPWSRPPQGAQQAPSLPAAQEAPALPATAAPEAGPAVEPAVEPDVEPVVAPAVEPAVEPDVEPVLEPAAEPAVEPVTAAPAAPDGGRREPVFGLPVDEELVAAPLPGHEQAQPVASAAPRPVQRAGDVPSLLTRESAASIHPPAASIPPPPIRTPAARRAEKAAARRSKLTPTRIEPQPKLRAAEIDEPEFVKRSRHQEQAGRTRRIAMLAGSIVLLLVLIAQAAITFRDALAARFPAAKPALVSACALLGCRVELPAQVDKLTIETGELTTLGDGAYAFATELRNEADTAQAWPSLELALLDADEKPLVRRVFAPTDYLAAGTLPANGIAAGAAQAIKLHFRVDDLKPSGYHIAVFYP